MIVGTLLQVSSSDLLIHGDEGTVLAPLAPKTVLKCCLQNSSTFLVSTLVTTIHNMNRAAIVRRQVLLYFKEIDFLATAITLIVAVHSETGDALVSISICEHIKMWIGLLGAPAGMVGVGSGFPPLDARCAVYAPTAVCLHSMGHGLVLDTLHRLATQGASPQSGRSC